MARGNDIRKKKVLEIILKAHIDHAEPVSSKYVSQLIGLSSATIRSLMTEMEGEGYLVQPHTSAGRIPTERAYRDYVNTLLDTWESNIEEIKRLNDELFRRYQRYNELVAHISYSIARLTHYMAFSVYPMDHLYLDGASYILEQPEFDNMRAIKKILNTLEEKEKMLERIGVYLAAGALKIHIGHENAIDGFEACSVVTASYKVRNKVVGGVGIIGPVRMKYKKVVPLVRYLADSISRMLERAYE
ncbi:MAG: hypothetical protein PHS37_10275 [Candidatus Omnitrophica bacterium]|nr:hypothetical protein [Candidatus Omnitrophota bacterium]